jgi:hypothetical protein
MIDQKEYIRRREIAFWNPRSENTPPDHVNEAGLLWWLDPHLSEWAQKEQVGFGGTMPSLPDAAVHFVKFPDGTFTRVLVMGGAVVEEDSSLEGMATQIDKHKIIAKMK